MLRCVFLRAIALFYYPTQHMGDYLFTAGIYPMLSGAEAYFVHIICDFADICLL